MTPASSASFVIFFPTIPTNTAKQVDDTRPAAARTDFSDVSAVEKYVMPADEYETRSDSVLAWKKAQKLGRFDPNAPSIEDQKVKALEREVEERGTPYTFRLYLLHYRFCDFASCFSCFSLKIPFHFFLFFFPRPQHANRG